MILIIIIMIILIMIIISIIFISRGSNTEFDFLCGPQKMIKIRPKKKLFVSCNPTLTSFYQEKSLPKVFSAFSTPNQRKTCIKHKFLTKEIMPKKYFTDLPTLLFSGPLQEINIFFFKA